MSDLKITVKDFRAIHSADIALNGITVIAGVNGSGKSTLSRLLYTIFDKVKTLDDVYYHAFRKDFLPIEEVCQQIFDTLKPTDLNQLLGIGVEEIRNDVQASISLLADSFSQDEKIKRLLSIIKYNLGIEIKNKDIMLNNVHNIVMENLDNNISYSTQLKEKLEKERKLQEQKNIH